MLTSNNKLRVFLVTLIFTIRKIRIGKAYNCFICHFVIFSITLHVNLIYLKWKVVWGPIFIDVIKISLNMLSPLCGEIILFTGEQNLSLRDRYVRYSCNIGRLIKKYTMVTRSLSWNLIKMMMQSMIYCLCCKCFNMFLD